MATPDIRIREDRSAVLGTLSVEAGDDSDGNLTVADGDLAVGRDPETGDGARIHLTTAGPPVDDAARIRLYGGLGRITVGGDGRGGSIQLFDSTRATGANVHSGNDSVGASVRLNDREDREQVRLEVSGDVLEEPGGFGRLRIRAPTDPDTTRVDINSGAPVPDSGSGSRRGGVVEARTEGGGAGVGLHGGQRAVIINSLGGGTGDDGDSGGDGGVGVGVDVDFSDDGTNFDPEAALTGTAMAYELTENSTIPSHHAGLSLGPRPDGAGPTVRINGQSGIFAIEEGDGTRLFEIDTQNETIRTKWPIEMDELL